MFLNKQFSFETTDINGNLEGKKDKNNCLGSDFESSHAFLSPALHVVKRGKFQKPIKIAHKAVILIQF